MPTPEQRIAASREKIRAALAPRQGGDGAHEEGARQSVWRGVHQLLGKVPLSRLALRSIERWWQQHPWRSSVNFVLDTTDELVRPVAEKHPWLLLAGALVVGVVIGRTRPWRLLSGGALLAGLIPQVRWASVIEWVTTVLRELPAHRDSGHEPPQAAGHKAPEGAVTEKV